MPQEFNTIEEYHEAYPNFPRRLAVSSGDDGNCEIRHGDEIVGIMSGSGRLFLEDFVSTDDNYGSLETIELRASYDVCCKYSTLLDLIRNGVKKIVLRGYEDGTFIYVDEKTTIDYDHVKVIVSLLNEYNVKFDYRGGKQKYQDRHLKIINTIEYDEIKKEYCASAQTATGGSAPWTP